MTGSKVYKSYEDNGQGKPYNLNPMIVIIIG